MEVIVHAINSIILTVVLLIRSCVVSKSHLNLYILTLEWALDLTQNAKGKHHLADFLPPDELEKFLEKVQAVREGREADFSDYSKYRIQSDNLGYKMLQKAGWEEGKGLGAKGEGIQQPVNK